MSIKEEIKDMVAQSIIAYDKINHENKQSTKDLTFKEEYQNKMINCLTGSIFDNYIETPLSDKWSLFLESSKAGIVKIPSIQGKTLLMTAQGEITETHGASCKLVSVGEDSDLKITIKAQNKNICPSEYTNEYITAEGELAIGAKTNILSRYIRLEPNTLYSGLALGSQGEILKYITWSAFDKNKKFIRILSGTESFTSEPGEYYLRVHRTGGDAPPRELQVTFGNPTEQFYKNTAHRREILLSKPLARLNNEVYDELIGDKIVRKVKKVKLKDIADGWSLNSEWSQGEYLAALKIINDREPRSFAISSMFPTMTYIESLVDGQIGKECIRYESSEKTLYIFIKKDRLETPDMIGFNKWLQSSVQDICYQLEVPEVEYLNSSISMQGYNSCTMTMDENPITPFISYGYDMSIPIKEEVVKQIQETNTNECDLEEFINPFLGDIEEQIQGL